MYSRKRSSSVDTETPPPITPPTRWPKLPRHEPSASPPGFHPAIYPETQQQKELGRTFDDLDIDSESSDSDEASFTETLHAPGSSSKQRDETTPSDPSAVSDNHLTDAGPTTTGSRKWTEWAQGYTTPDDCMKYRCIWPEQDKHGGRTPCGYTSKRHLVKRHVESKHLKLRPCICKICGKGFSQKSNLETHMNTHTGEAPHKCPYYPCEQTFKDPARRHRHMRDDHGHVSSRSRKDRLQPGTFVSEHPNERARLQQQHGASHTPMANRISALIN